METIIETENKRRMANMYNNKNLLITCDNWTILGMPHFVHTMEYFYFATSIILQYKNYLIVLQIPQTSYISTYVISYINFLYKKLNNFIFIENINNFNYDLVLKFSHFCGIMSDNADNNKNGFKKMDNFISWKDNSIKNGYYNLWFPHTNMSDIDNIHNFFSGENKKKMLIGLINRRMNNGRSICNELEICSKIKERFNVDVNVIYFENISFEEQISFFENHNIIISPHGAQLVSIPFAPKEALIIECCHEEYHPYYYFPGLSYSSNKNHIMLCHDHSVFPNWRSPIFEKHNQLKLNMNVKYEKIIEIIEYYTNNNYTLNEKKCYLY
uniref:Glycosyltransferase 61 catalytic domain-containing protein n=1 Tax=viral metagenome TaxID=1070528 RepID=A0A6C0ARV4_9ZZZZ